ncbi:MAG: cytochrome c peroxidase [Myxococcota bacterium]|jgi:cytochrome c peroxidase
MRLFPLLLSVALVGCGSTPPPAPEPEAPVEAPAPPPPPKVSEQHLALFAPLPAAMEKEGGPERTEALIALGRMLYYDPRLSSNQEQSCNTCHQLDNFGVDSEATSLGVKGERGGRNSPTSVNAAGHFAQFWDGRAPDVETQALGPILNPVEMNMPNPGAAVTLLQSIPGYRDAFKAAFPGDDKPITYDNVGAAIGAFERGLVSPGKWDAYLEGDVNALGDVARAGVDAFIGTGCASCHMGPYVGGQMYAKLGQSVPYDTSDLGRMEVTKDEADKYMFKVPSLRNVAKTGPWLHDGSITDLEEMIRLMGKHQLGRDLDDATVTSIRAFLGALTGELDATYIAKPELPASGPKTPGPS